MRWNNLQDRHNRYPMRHRSASEQSVLRMLLPFGPNAQHYLLVDNPFLDLNKQLNWDHQRCRNRLDYVKYQVFQYESLAQDLFLEGSLKRLAQKQ